MLILSSCVAQAFWKKHQLSQYKADWMKITKAKGDFKFWRGSVSDGLFDWAIDNYLIKSHTNNHIEGESHHILE